MFNETANEFGVGFIVVVYVVATLWTVFKARGLDVVELEQNVNHPAPDDLQVRWHIRHIRQDLRLLALIRGADQLLRRCYSGDPALSDQLLTR